MALDLAPGPGFVAALRRIWDDGDAVLPVDQRLPPPARQELLAAMAPEVVVGPDDERGRRWAGGEARPVEDGDALVVATSGSTGTAKGVVLTHAAVAAHAAAVHARLAVDPQQDRWLACLPLAHVGGLGVVTRAVVTATPLEVHPRFDPVAVAAAGATLVALVPSALDRLVPTAVSRFRRVVLGGSADPGPRPANVVRTYGLTESGGGVVYDGRPLDGVEVRSVDGEIELRGPMLLRAYRDGRVPLASDGWLPTGDLGTVGPDGTVTVHGRRAELIVTGGDNVWPAAVEAVLSAHPAVSEVAVAGRADPEWGQRVVAFVVPRLPRHPPDLADLRAAVKERLPAHAAPRELVLVDRLARTTLGKVRRHPLPDR